MTERPLLIKPDLVWPVMEDRKTETRRLRDLEAVNDQPDRWVFSHFDGLDQKGRLIAVFKWVRVGKWKDVRRDLSIPCPYGNVGDQLWVRETFMPLTVGYGYKADGLIRTGKNPETGQYYVPRLKWTPSIHMPRKASRIQLEILKIGVERLHDITEEAAIREGVTVVGTAILSFNTLWQSINGPESFVLNPWLWVITFKRLIS